MIQPFRMCAQAATAAAGRALRELAEFQVGQVRSTSRLSSARSCFTTPRLPLSSLIFLEAEPLYSNDKACFMNFKYLYIFYNLCYFNICYISSRVTACLTLTFFLDPQSGEGYGDGGGDFIFGFASSCFVFFLKSCLASTIMPVVSSQRPFFRLSELQNLLGFIACDVDIEFAIGYVGYVC